ncbi:MAG: hypothetical protein Q7J46_07405 [Pseudomonas sp.]|nr:hypothetical protein [Pseudomonas sp.]
MIERLDHLVLTVADIPRTGAIDLCLITNWSIDAVLKHLAEQGVAVEQGPVKRSGAVGPIESVADGNLIEVSRYL